MTDLSDASRYCIFSPMDLSRTGAECKTFTKGVGQIASGLALEAVSSAPNRLVVPFGPGSVL